MLINGAGIQSGGVNPAGSQYIGVMSNLLGEQIALRSHLIARLTLTNPVAADDDAFVTAAAGPNATTTTYKRSGLTGGTAFAGVLATGVVDFPRNVTLTATHGSSLVALTAVVTGIDWHGRAATETLTITATGTSKVATGLVAFRRVDTVAVTAATDASADTIKVGFGNVFGLEFKTAVPKALVELSAGSVVTNGTVVAGSTSANTDYRGTYAPNSAPNGSTTYVVYYLVPDATDGVVS